MKTKKVNNSNGHAQQRFAITQNGRRFVVNEETISRLALMASTGTLPELNIDGECRYPQNLTLNDFQKMYDREGIATRAVTIYPQESWAMSPEIYETENLETETEFEKAWAKMDEDLNILTFLQTADELSGIGNYGILLLGFDDGRPLDQPIGGLKDDGTVDGRYKKPHNLVYVRPMQHTFASVKDFENNTSNARYGQPNLYSLQLVTFNQEQLRIPNDQSLTTLANAPNQITPVPVHWTRVLHLAESDGGPFATPKLQNIYNRIFDIRKILGANGQGYWNSGIPSISVETQPGVDDAELDIESVKHEVQDFMMGLQRALALDGMTAKSLNFTVNDPGPHVNTHLLLLCASIGVPMRNFLGTEEGKLASTQDTRTWNKRLMRRQNTYITPRILRPFFQRMFAVGALPRPKKLIVEWPDLNAPTENDRATTAAKVTTALVQYISGNVFIIMKPKEYLINVIGLSASKVNAILSAAVVKDMMRKLDKLAQAAMAMPATAVGGATVNRGKKSLPRKTKKSPAFDGAGPAA